MTEAYIQETAMVMKMMKLTGMMMVQERIIML